MASSSGTSSGSSTQLQNSTSEEDLQALMKQRKQKRSNRESARRSRMRKQKHLDELMASVTQLKKENSQILSAISFTSQHYMLVEAENAVLRTQVIELNTRLQSLDEILCFLNGSSGLESYGGFEASESFMRQPLVASADMFHYC